MTFSASIFASIFDGKWLPKWSSRVGRLLQFWLPFRDLFRRSIFGYILVALWLLLGSLLAPFGSLLVHFWCPLAHFWCPWVHFCSPWRSIFSLLGSPGAIFNIVWYFRWESYVKSYFWGEMFTEIPIVVFFCFETLSTKHPKTIPGTVTVAPHRL